MNKSGPIIIVDDDSEDLEMFAAALDYLQVKNKVLVFERSEDFLNYMNASDEMVFFILCDINMPNTDGFELRSALSADLSLASKSIPFLFFSTSNNIKHIAKAYEHHIQGYFQKPSTFNEIVSLFEKVISYWNTSFSP